VLSLTNGTAGAGTAFGFASAATANAPPGGTLPGAALGNASESSSIAGSSTDDSSSGVDRPLSMALAPQTFRLGSAQAFRLGRGSVLRRKPSGKTPTVPRILGRRQLPTPQPPQLPKTLQQQQHEGKQ
jgi:hypothetical protein